MNRTNADSADSSSCRLSRGVEGGSIWDEELKADVVDRRSSLVSWLSRCSDCLRSRRNSWNMQDLADETEMYLLLDEEDE